MVGFSYEVIESESEKEEENEKKRRRRERKERRRRRSRRKKMMPSWLKALLSESKFFSACSDERHTSAKKNEMNIFCLDCRQAICQHCLSSHSHLHKLLQIRRYVYHDVVRIEDIHDLIDCSHVQPYIINSAKVVFLNARPQPRPIKGPGNLCEHCDRSLQDPYKYCSMGCKVEAMIRREEGLQTILYTKGVGGRVMHSESSDNAMIASCNGARNDCCLTSPASPPRSIRIKTKVSRVLAGVRSDKDMLDKMQVNLIGDDDDDAAADDDDEEQEQLSPNTVLDIMASTPTSSTSIQHADFTWSTSRPVNGVTNVQAYDMEVKKPRMFNKTSSLSSFACVYTNRRKSRPHRSPIL